MSAGASRSTGETGGLIDDLDELIRLMIQQIKSAITKHTKVGDLIRMIELRYKLLPDNSSQKDFWKMMERIRQEKLRPAKDSLPRSDTRTPDRKAES